MKATPRRAKAPRRKRRAARKPTRRKRPAPKPKQAGKPRLARKPRQAQKAAPPRRRTLEALEKESHRLRQVRGRLERRLTAAVQEIGTLRNFELRVQILERQLRARDEEISRLRQELGERSGGPPAVPARP